MRLTLRPGLGSLNAALYAEIKNFNPRIVLYKGTTEVKRLPAICIEVYNWEKDKVLPYYGYYKDKYTIDCAAADTSKDEYAFDKITLERDAYIVGATSSTLIAGFKIMGSKAADDTMTYKVIIELTLPVS